MDWVGFGLLGVGMMMLATYTDKLRKRLREAQKEIERLRGN